MPANILRNIVMQIRQISATNIAQKARRHAFMMNARWHFERMMLFMNVIKFWMMEHSMSVVKSKTVKHTSEEKFLIDFVKGW